MAKEVADDFVIAYGVEILYARCCRKIGKEIDSTLNDSHYALIELV